ncbi:MAG TPA: helix-turn-helix transcriptional regulator [Verrucomicrobiae bacterium]|jgi:AraC-like DNA-binding protein|nr:helix-turn-helix transcriptional regulator [Verrucomicrobiae bacterium]
MKRSADLPETLSPVLAFEDCYPARYVDAMHTHDRGQLSFALSGVMKIATDEGSYFLPPNRAIWIPAGVRHQVYCRGEVRFLVLYVDAQFGRQSRTTRVFEVSPLVRALMGEVATFTDRHVFNERENKLVDLLFEEMERMPLVLARAALPTDRQLRRVCEAIIAEPSDTRSIDAWAKVAGMGRRTFTRAFRNETGMSLAVWRSQVRVMEAAERIASGESINTVAYEMGYESASAFIAMFHRVLGAPPRAYCRAQRETQMQWP